MGSLVPIWRWWWWWWLHLKIRVHGHFSSLCCCFVFLVMSVNCCATQPVKYTRSRLHSCGDFPTTDGRAVAREKYRRRPQQGYLLLYVVRENNSACGRRPRIHVNERHRHFRVCARTHAVVQYSALACRIRGRAHFNIYICGGMVPEEHRNRRRHNSTNNHWATPPPPPWPQTVSIVRGMFAWANYIKRYTTTQFVDGISGRDLSMAFMANACDLHVDVMLIHVQHAELFVEDDESEDRSLLMILG